MENKWKESMKVHIPQKIPYDIDIELSEEEQAKLLEDSFFKAFSEYNEKFDSEEVQYYFHNLVSSILKEYHRYFPGYSTEASYRFKAPKSLADKIIDYMSRKDRSKLEYDEKQEKYKFSIDEIKDVFAMKLILKERPSTFHSKDSKINELVAEKVKNQEFIADMQKFQNKLVEDEFSINPKYLYDVTKEEYYKKCIEVIDRLILLIDRKDLPDNQRPKKLIEKYERIKKSLEESLEIVETLPDGTLIDETDYPAKTLDSSENPEQNIDFTKLLNKFSSKMYNELDLAILNRQANSIFENSEILKKLGVTKQDTKEKRTELGYISDFIYLNTPAGVVECQLQPEEAYKDGNYGDTAHGGMKGKVIKGFKVPDPNDQGQVKRFKDSVAYVSPKYYIARMDEVEEGKIVIQGYTDYKNYRNVIGQVKKGSPQEKALLSYFDTIYSLRDRIFDSNGKMFEFIGYDIDKYIKSPELQAIKDKSEKTQEENQL